MQDAEIAVMSDEQVSAVYDKKEKDENNIEETKSLFPNDFSLDDF
jgi:acetyl-CoA carboxylase carboxyltransferase component